MSKRERENEMSKYTVKLELELANGRTIKDTVQARSAEHVEMIRQEARADAPLGSTQSIKVTKN